MTKGHGKAERVGKVRVSNCHAIDAAWAAAEMKAVRAMNKRARSDKTYHMMVSFREGEQPDTGTLQAIEDRLCERWGRPCKAVLRSGQVFLRRHRDLHI